jgi:hypothetical protein
MSHALATDAPWMNLRKKHTSRLVPLPQVATATVKSLVSSSSY